MNPKKPAAASALSLVAGFLSLFNALTVMSFLITCTSIGPGSTGSCNGTYYAADWAAALGLVIVLLSGLMFVHVKFHHLYGASIILASIGGFAVSMGSQVPLDAFGLVWPALVLGLIGGALGVVWKPVLSTSPIFPRSAT